MRSYWWWKVATDFGCILINLARDFWNTDKTAVAIFYNGMKSIAPNKSQRSWMSIFFYLQQGIVICWKTIVQPSCYKFGAEYITPTIKRCENQDESSNELYVKKWKEWKLLVKLKTSVLLFLSFIYLRARGSYKMNFPAADFVTFDNRQSLRRQHTRESC